MAGWYPEAIYIGQRVQEKQFGIFALDMKNADPSKWELKKSKVRCPTRFVTGEKYWGKIELFQTGGVESKPCLVIGYIRQCFENDEFANIPLLPTYIIQMIAK